MEGAAWAKALKWDLATEAGRSGSSALWEEGTS